MSYDISFCIREKNTNELIRIGGEANITWNVRELIKQSSGWDIKNEDTNGLAKDLIPMIDKGRMELEWHPEKYKQYESPNGWGTIDGVWRFYKRMFLDWEEIKEDWKYRKVIDYIEVYVD